MTTIQTPSAFDFVKHHPLASALALSTLSAAAYYYFTHQQPSTPCTKRVKTQPNNDQSLLIQQLQIMHQLNNLKSTREKLIAASKDFKIEFLQEEILTNLLTEECVLDIFDKCIELVDQEELNRVYEISRKARRSVFQKILINASIKQIDRKESLQSLKSHQNQLSFSAPMEMTSPRNLYTLKSKLHRNIPISYPEALSFSQIYYRFVCTFEEEFKYLIQKTQKDFATFLNIDFSLITESIDFHISKENNDYFKHKIEEWTSAIRQILKNKLTKYTTPIDPQKIRQILRYQIDYLTQKRSKLRETINKLGISNEEQLDALPTLLATILEDEVFFRFNIEQEQMTVDFMHLSKNKELEMLVEEFQSLTERIVEEMYEEVNKDAIQDDDDYEQEI